MNSSGMKRGFAATAISAMAITGLPMLAGAAHAETLNDQTSGVEILSPEETGTTNGPGGSDADAISAKNDGQNNTVSLVAVAEDDVTSLLFQYRVAGDTEWIDINGALARNADGAFETEWTPSVAANTSIELRAVADTGDEDRATATVLGTGDNVTTVELSTEGDLGIYQDPYTDTDYVAVHGTTSDPVAASVAVYDQLNDVNAAGAVSSVEGEDGVSRFSAVLGYANYPYSPGTDANQVAISAAVGYPQTGDTEASTLYVQTVDSVTAVPKNSNITSGTTPTTVTVLDQQGKPVAGAKVGYLTSQDNPDTPQVEAPDDTESAGTTDADGKVTLDLGPGTYTVYADTDATGGAGYSDGDVKAAPFTIGQYTAKFTSIDIVNERNRSNFDNDELADTDDFTIVTKDQNGNPINEDLTGADVQYRFVITPSNGDDTITTDWAPAETNADGEAAVTVPNTVDGTYRLEARRPNVAGTGLTNAEAETFTVSDAAVSFDEGADANAPIEGSYTVTGKLANDEGGLGGRELTVTYGGSREDSTLAPQSEQPAGVTVDATRTSATVVTKADGTFAVKLTDPAGPVVIDDNPEDATLTVTEATEAKGDSTELNVTPKSIDVHFQAAAEVDSIDIDVDDSNAAPGRPADVNVTVYGPDGSDSDTDPDVITDEPVSVSIDKGFLTDGTLADGHDEEGDEYGYFKSLEQDEDISTGDNGQAADIEAAIERDAGFDDDGMVTATITVKAGDKTETKSVTWDSRKYVNLGSLELQRVDGSGDAEVGTDVGFNVWAKDQFGNLVGDKYARISDDSTVADFRTDGDFGQTQTDFTTSGVGVEAFSDAPAVQTLMATLYGVTETMVDANGNPVATSTRTVTDAAEPINWVDAADDGGKINPALVVKGHGHKGDDDTVIANAIRKAEGAKATLLKKKKNGKKVVIATATLNSKGNHRWHVADKNGKKKTTYKVHITATSKTKKGHGGTRLH